MWAAPHSTKEMDVSRPYPSNRRVLLGLAAATISAAAPILLVGPIAIIAFPVALVVTGVHVVFLAFPTYMVLRRWFELWYLNSAVAGFLIGCVPVTVLGIPAYWNSLSGAASSPEMIAARFGPSLIAGALGAIGGLTFRKVVGRIEHVPDYAASFE